jgi:hypothetical protein
VRVVGFVADLDCFGSGGDGNKILSLGSFFFFLCYEILVLSMKLKSANKDWCDL